MLWQFDCQNFASSPERTHTRLIMLFTELSKALTCSQNQLRSEESRLKPKVKLALLPLSFRVPSRSRQHLQVNIKLDPAKPERKVRQNVCIFHSSKVILVTCQNCQENN
ncbi:unnamed protein product [Rotaria socialis]|uniref:Uncharacterized protein n=1 Tax=Rotaria socialis TaxID=392032 RepID=A0A819WPW9_9BILA|nr:unnamed protein product [Rotaria socialis]CAF4561469.1 unnamed protein product [Rotaria socialis]CAF4897053.1 unnamed protein product [Rotaria socialis]